jgi:hypothetical protein
MRNDFSTRPHLCSELILIEGDRMQPISGNLEEVGEGSFLLLTDVDFQPGEAVTIRAKTHQFKGFVENSQFDKCLGYFVEVRLAAESLWSEAVFQPEHMLKSFALENTSVTEEIVPAAFERRCGSRMPPRRFHHSPATIAIRRGSRRHSSK